MSDEEDVLRRLTFIITKKEVKEIKIEYRRRQ